MSIRSESHGCLTQQAEVILAMSGAGSLSPKTDFHALSVSVRCDFGDD